MEPGRVQTLTLLDRNDAPLLSRTRPGDCAAVAATEFVEPSGQDFWIDLHAASGDTTDPQRHIAAESGFRCPAQSDAYALQAGIDDPYTAPFVREQVSITRVEVPGPISRRDFTLAENERVRAMVSYVFGADMGETYASDRVIVPALTVRDLEPGAIVITPGAPALVGTAKVGTEIIVEPSE